MPVNPIRRLSILLAAFAVLVVSTAYVAHLHKQDLQAGAGGDHCDLCLQIGRGAAPAPAPALAVTAGTRWYLALILVGVRVALSRTLDRAHQARAPPAR